MITRRNFLGATIALGFAAFSDWRRKAQPCPEPIEPHQEMVQLELGPWHGQQMLISSQAQAIEFPVQSRSGFIRCRYERTCEVNGDGLTVFWLRDWWPKTAVVQKSGGRSRHVFDAGSCSGSRLTWGDVPL